MVADEAMVTVSRDHAFRPRTVAECDEYYSERAAIGEYERGMSREEAEAAARIMAGPRPEERGQLTLTGEQAKWEPRRAARSRR
jgi:hypothetical protein